jgi:Fic family protein
MYEPNFKLNNNLLINIGKIEAAREIILNAPLLPLWEKRFREEALVRTVHHGTHLEGNQLDFEEAKEVVLSQNLHSIRTRDVQEVINYREVMDYIEDEWQEKDKDITEALIKKIHKLAVSKILPDNIAGAYRLKNVVIKDSHTGEVTFRPPEPEQLQYLIIQLLKWLNTTRKDTLHPVLKAAITHYELVRIHPFIDGNGRVARAIATLILYSEGYDIRRFFSLEEYFDKDPLRYYQYLQKAGSGDLTPWLDYFVQGLAAELEKIKTKIQKLSSDTHLKQKLGGRQVFLNERQTKIIEYIQEIGYLQNKAFASLFPDFSDDTVLRDLSELIENKLIKKIGKTKGAKYILT